MPTYEITVGDEVFEVDSEAELTDEEIYNYASSYISEGAKDNPDAFRQLDFGMSEQAGFTENLGLIMDSYLPLGKLDFSLDSGFTYYSPEDIYGEGYSTMSQEQRLEFLRNNRQEALKKEYADIYESGLEDSGYATLGNIGGALADPSTVIPIGQTIKGMTALGATLGGAFSAAEQKVQEGQVTAGNVATGAALGGTGAAVLGAAGKGVSSLLRKRSDRKAVESATQTMNEAEVAMAKAVRQDIPLKNMPEFVQQATGKTREELVEAAQLSGFKPKVPTKQEAEIIDNVGEYGIDAVSRASNGIVDQFLGVLSTRVGMISEPIKGKLRKLDLDSHVNSHEKLQVVKPFEKAVSSLPKQSRETVNRMLLNGNWKGVEGILSKYSQEAPTQVKQVRSLLDSTYEELKKAGYKDLRKVPNYFPRVVKDVDGLLNAVGKEKKSAIQKAFANKQKQLNVDSLSNEQKSEVINSVLRGYAPKINNGGLGFAQQRSIGVVDEKLAQYYEDPLLALNSYIRSTVSNIERRKFFGQYAENTGESSIDVGKSIDNLILQEADKLSPTDVDVLRSLLNARFINGERGASGAIQALRNTGYATTLANPLSAITQIADLSVSAYVNGFRNTLAAILSPNKKIDMRNFGLDDVVAEEFANEAVMAKALHKLFTASGFRQIDRFGKNALMRSSWNKATKLAKSPKGIAKLRDKYGKVYGDEFENLVADLREGNVTENTKLYLWSELADFQPVSLSEMPQKYLEAPNGRLFYSLKTWMLKQLDVLRRDVKQQWSKGNKKEAIRNGVAYMLLIPTANMGVEQTKNLLLAREPIEPEDIPDEWVSNVFKIFGGSEYLNDRYLKRGDIAGAGLNMIAPPLNYVSSVGESVIQAAEGEAPTAILSEVPIVGRFWYNFFGGGLEAWEERQE